MIIQPGILDHTYPGTKHHSFSPGSGKEPAMTDIDQSNSVTHHNTPTYGMCRQICGRKASKLEPLPQQWSDSIEQKERNIKDLYPGSPVINHLITEDPMLASRFRPSQEGYEYASWECLNCFFTGDEEAAEYLAKRNHRSQKLTSRRC